MSSALEAKLENATRRRRKHYARSQRQTTAYRALAKYVQKLQAEHEVTLRSLAHYMDQWSRATSASEMLFLREQVRILWELLDAASSWVGDENLSVRIAEAVLDSAPLDIRSRRP